MTVLTPLACKQQTENEILEKLKTLGVYGYDKIISNNDNISNGEL
jgi:hypothetical protein